MNKIFAQVLNKLKFLEPFNLTCTTVLNGKSFKIPVIK